MAWHVRQSLEVGVKHGAQQLRIPMCFMLLIAHDRSIWQPTSACWPMCRHDLVGDLPNIWASMLSVQRKPAV